MSDPTNPLAMRSLIVRVNEMHKVVIFSELFAVAAMVMCMLFGSSGIAAACYLVLVRPAEADEGAPMVQAR